jgi:MFS transporter, PPP family, 3-phenylpropionic acid transporter
VTADRRGGGEAPRLALAYVALFTVLGVHLPYWPVWLAHRGMEPEQIGVLLGVLTWARLVAPWAGSWADRRGGAARLASALAVAHLLCFSAFAFADSFVFLLLLSVGAGLFYAPLTPLFDGIAVGAAAAGRIDYGRVRLWGSAAFVLASSGAGLALQGRSPSLILAAILVASAALWVATLFLPSAPARPIAPPTRLLAMLRRPHMGTFLLAAGFLQGSHAVLYGFGTRHWQAIGLGESAIGGLWSWGVIVEIGLFAIGQRLVASARPTGLMVIAAAAGLLRWPLLAEVESLPIIWALQSLHGATFACMHLGSMSWIRDNIEPEAVQRATALYVAVTTGVALGVGMLLAGFLFDRFGGGAYHAMGLSSAIGLLFALRLSRLRHA